MASTHAVTMGDRGRLVIPAEVRKRGGLRADTPLILVAGSSGLALLTREQAREELRRQLEGSDLVGELLAERRRAAAPAHPAA